MSWKKKEQEKMDNETRTIIRMERIVYKNMEISDFEALHFRKKS